MLNHSVLEEQIKCCFCLYFFCDNSDEGREHKICFWVEGVNCEGEKFLKYLRDFFSFHMRLKWGKMSQNTSKMSYVV